MIWIGLKFRTPRWGLYFGIIFLLMLIPGSVSTKSLNATAWTPPARSQINNPPMTMAKQIAAPANYKNTYIHSLGEEQDPPPIQWVLYAGNSESDGFFSVIQTADGGFIVSGWTKYDENTWLMKTDAHGELQWMQIYDWGNFIVSAVIQTSDGGYALAVGTQLVKTNALGKIQWTRTYNGSFYDIIQTTDGGYALAGYSRNKNNESWDKYDFWLVKTDAQGTIEWSQTYAGSDRDDRVHAVIQTPEGSFVLAGITDPSETYEDIWIAKTDDLGNEEWTQTYGGSDEDMAYSVIQAIDGGYAFAGQMDDKACLLKTDAHGVSEWIKIYGQGEDGRFETIIQPADGGYAPSGYKAGYGAWLVKTDHKGEMEWEIVSGESDSAREIVSGESNSASAYRHWNNAFSIIQTSDGGVCRRWII